MSQRQQNLVILGSTGSIGQQALELIRESPNQYRILGLSTGSSWEQLAHQSDEFQPDVLSVAREEDRKRLVDQLDSQRSAPESLPDVVCGRDGLEELASHPDVDIVLNAVTGAAGLPGTLAAIRSDKRVALANKESLLIAGSLINRLLEEHDAELIPVDSEHSALFQLLQGINRSEVKRLFLTASGGPFRTWSREQIQEATPSDALDHPTWNMGPKITIDSATLMNKAIELVEAKHLFPFEMDRIDVVIHPQSRIHAMVELIDGSLLTHMGPPDMKTPIQYSFTYPERARDHEKQLEFSDDLQFTFESPRTDLFPALELGYYAGREEGTCGAVLNGANEVAVDAFLNEEISFPAITNIVKDVLYSHEKKTEPNLNELLDAEASAREEARTLVSSTQPHQTSKEREISES